MFLFVLAAPTFLGRSRQSLRACASSPHSSRTRSLRNLVAWNVLTPRLYHSPPSSAAAPRLLMLQAGLLRVEVPWRRRHELRDVGVDLVAIFVELRGGETILRCGKGGRGAGLVSRGNPRTTPTREIEGGGERGERADDAGEEGEGGDARKGSRRRTLRASSSSCALRCSSRDLNAPDMVDGQPHRHHRRVVASSPLASCALGSRGDRDFSRRVPVRVRTHVEVQCKDASPRTRRGE